jgi:hypothetical protein
MKLQALRACIPILSRLTRPGPVLALLLAATLTLLAQQPAAPRVPFARIDAQGMYDYAISQYVPARFTNYVTGKVTTTVPKANVVIPEGTPDPLLGGLSYVQFARQGLALQRSQIGNNARLASAGAFDVSYHRYGSRVLVPDGKPEPDGDDSGLETSLFDGIDTSLPGIATLAAEVADKFRPGLQRLDDLIAKAQRDFDPAKSEAIAPTLRQALCGLNELIAELEKPGVNDLPPAESSSLLHELRIKRVQLNNALVLAHGLTLKAIVKQLGTPDASALSELLTPRSEATFHLTISESGQDALKLDEARISVPGKTVPHLQRQRRRAPETNH